MSKPLHRLSITEAGKLLRSAELSPVELVEAHLERIARLDGELHAFITVAGHAALKAAKVAENDILAGRYRGPLHGIPIAHKDIIETAGVLTTAHSNALRNYVPSTNATVVDRLATAGAISLGKTALHEFAFGSPGTDEAFPAARNPWNPNHMPGSSSSGSAVAVAAGMAMGATGTDTGGSVRHPSAVCATVGMKPTFGRVSCAGVIPLAPSMDHVGPLTRTVADNAIMLQAMAGHDPRDPRSITDAAPEFSGLIGQDIRGLRIGVLRAYIDLIEHTPETLAGFAVAAAALRDLGAKLEDVEPNEINKSHDAGSLIIAYEAYRHHRDQLETTPELLGSNLRARLAYGAQISAEAVAKARATQTRLREAISRIFDRGIVAIINPARERPAETMSELYADPLGKRSVSLRMYSLTGHPAVVVPIGLTSHGLPLSMQIASAMGREDTAYQVAYAYEQAADWSHACPYF